MMPQARRSNEWSGYPPDARLLIVNADDFGMSHSINVATLQAMREGLVASCTLMVPCPWSLHGIHLLTENPDIPFGVHLTAVSEWRHYRWGPVTPREQVPSLLDEAGYFYVAERIDEFLDRVNLRELETEFRAQIEHVLAAGLKPTHLDSHCETHSRHPEVFEMTFRLAQDYGLALRVSTESARERIHAAGYPAADHDLTDSYRIAVPGKAETYARLLRSLPAGLSELALHPGIGDGELRAFCPTWETRQADFDFFTSREAREIVAEENIVILSYAQLQDLWKSVTASMPSPESQAE